MPVYTCDLSALADKVVEVEANGELIVGVVHPTESVVMLVTRIDVDGRRKPRGVETR